jgi:hypothetical protein
VVLLALLSGPAVATAPELLAAAQRLGATAALEAIEAAAPCAFAPTARHLGPLPARLLWSRPAALVIFDGLDGQAADHRAILLRPTRELLARQATRSRIVAGDITLHDIALNALPATAPEAAFMALHFAPPPSPVEGCITPFSP